METGRKTAGRKEVKEIKMVVVESSWKKYLKSKATAFPHLRLPLGPVGKEDILLSLHFGSSRKRQ